MTPVEIAAQIETLYADLGTALADEDTDWDGDYHALLSKLADAQTAAADTIDQIANNALAMDGREWQEVVDHTYDAATELRGVAFTLNEAADSAEDGQRQLSDQA